MSQVTIYLPDDVERQLRAAARKAGKSFSSYIAELAMRKRTRKAWPRAFLATFGAWKGEFPEPPELPVGGSASTRSRLPPGSLHLTGR